MRCHSSPGPEWHEILIKPYRQKPFQTEIGVGKVIKGWDEGLVGMKVGGERMLEIPPQMGYGKRKMSDIPANSTLHFGTCFFCAWSSVAASVPPLLNLY